MSSAFLYLGIVLMWLCVLVPMWLRRDRHPVDIAELYNDGDESDGDTLADVPVREAPSAGGAHAADADDDDEVTVAFDTHAAHARAVANAAQGSDSTAGPLKSGHLSGDPHNTDPRGVDPRNRIVPGPRDVDVLNAGPPETDALNSAPRKTDARSSGSWGAAVFKVDPRKQDDPGKPSGSVNLSQEAYRRRARLLARRRRWLFCGVLFHLVSAALAVAGVVPWWSVTPSAVLLLSYLAVLRAAVAADAERRIAVAKAWAARERNTRERQRALEVVAQQQEAEVIEFRKPAEPFDQYADRKRRAVGD